MTPMCSSNATVSTYSLAWPSGASNAPMPCEKKAPQP